MSNQGEKKGVSALDFFCIGFGAIVGVGWAVSINNWMANSGGPVPAAVGYLLCLLVMVPFGLVYCELVPMLPVAGGGAAFAYAAFGEKVSFLSGWAAFGAFVAIIPWEAIQITDVLGYLIPGLKVGKLYTIMGSDIYASTVIIGAVFSILLFLLNKRGLGAAATLQKFLCVFLVGSAVIGAIAAVVKGNVANLQPIYDTANPAIYGSAADGLKEVTHKSFMGGAFSIITAAAFFLAGFETIPQGVEEAGGDIKSVGKTVVLSVGLACVFYALLLFCFGMGFPWQNFYGLPNPAASNMFKEIYSGGAGVFLYWLITVGAIAGLFTTWNGFFTASANLLMAMGRSRMIPAFFAKQDKNGVAINGLLLVLILSLIGPFLGANMIDTVTCFSATAFVLSWMISSLSLLRLRKTMPHANRPFKLATPIAVWAGIVGVIFFVGMLIPITPFYVGSKALIIFVVYIVIGIVLHLASGGQRNQLSAHERMKNMFGNLDLDEMRKM
ncbi:MAG: APC family permease [Bacillota bacterium]|nr:APC family permease [Bacillota bacterium]